MSKHDAVDQLMRMATQEATREATPEATREVTREATRVAGQGRDRAGSRGGSREAEAVLEAKVTATEPGLPVQTASLPGERGPASATAMGAQVSPGERGRALFQAVRPFLPAVGGALRRVPHPAGRVAADLLPWLGNMGAMVADRMGSRLPTGTAALPEGPVALHAVASDARMAQLAGQWKESRERLDAVEEQLRRTREALERTVAEQGTLAHQAHGLTDRVRLLTACVLILLMLVAAQIVLLAVYLHR